MSISMPKVYLFGIKIGNKSLKTRNLLTAKSVIKTTSNKISSLRKRATLLMLMMMTMVAGTLFAAPSLSMAQQTNTGTATVTPPPPLTPEEQQQQDRLQSIMAATTRNLIQGQKQIDGLVYTPR